MIICPHFANKTVLVFGLGKTGTGALKSMIASGATVLASDDNPKMFDHYLDAKIDYIDSKNLPQLDWGKLDYIILSPGVPTLKSNEHLIVQLAHQHNIPIISDLDILYLACPSAKYVGITGTNGKSTTTALIGHIFSLCGFKVQVGGNIGTSVLELEAFAEDGIYVIEASSFQLELSQHIKFNISALLNITPDHLDRHGNMENYINTKKKIFNHHSQNIISLDSDVTQEIYHSWKDAISISGNITADISMVNRILTDTINNLKFDFNSYGYLPGQHNQENIAAAYAVCMILGAMPADIATAIYSFQGLKHRIQEVLDTGKLKFINDSKATNAEAAEKAIKCFDDIYWIAGGVAKVGGITTLSSFFEKMKRIYLIGSSTAEFAKTLDDFSVTYKKVATIEAALNDLKADEAAQGVVLLSPACASYDQFQSYEHRGDVFCRLVKEKFISV